MGNLAAGGNLFGASRLKGLAPPVQAPPPPLPPLPGGLPGDIGGPSNVPAPEIPHEGGGGFIPPAVIKALTTEGPGTLSETRGPFTAPSTDQGPAGAGTGILGEARGLTAPGSVNSAPITIRGYSPAPAGLPSGILSNVMTARPAAVNRPTGTVPSVNPGTNPSVNPGGNTGVNPGGNTGTRPRTKPRGTSRPTYMF